MAEATIPTPEQAGSAFDLLGKSLAIVKRNWRAFAVVNIFSILAAIAAVFPESFYDGRDPNKYAQDFSFGGASGFQLGGLLGLGLAFVILLVLVNIYLYAMSVILEVRASQGKNPAISQVFNEAKKYWLRLFLLAIVSAFIVVIGLILLIVPGVIAFGRIIMAPYLMVDKDLGIMDALKKSNEMGKRYRGAVWGAIGVTLLIVLASMLLGIVPALGGIMGTLLVIAYSLVLPLRYIQLKKLRTA